METDFWLERWETDGLEIVRGDFFDLVPGDLGDVRGVYDRASLVALPPRMRERYAAHLTALVPDAAVVLLVTMEYPEGEMQGPPYCVHEDEVRQWCGGSYAIDRLFALDVLAESPRFRDRGVGFCIPERSSPPAANHSFQVQRAIRQSQPFEIPEPQRVGHIRARPT